VRYDQAIGNHDRLVCRRWHHCGDDILTDAELAQAALIILTSWAILLCLVLALMYFVGEE